MKIFGIEFKFNGFDVWHKGNQGSSSGMDADTVDGKHSSDFAPSGYGLGTDAKDLGSGADLNTIKVTGFYKVNAGVNVPPRVAGDNTSIWHYIEVVSHDYGWVVQNAWEYSTGTMFTRVYHDNASWTAWRKVWTDINDGSGSGLDADLLDGQHASAFAQTSSVPTKVSQLTNDSAFVTANNHSHKVIDVSDTRSVNHNGFDYQGITVHLKNNTTDGLNDGGTYHGVVHITQWADSSGGRAHQLGFTDNGNIWFRDWNGSTWTAWVKLAKTTDVPTKLSELTNDIGAGGGVKITTSTVAPASPSPGDFWYKEV